MNKNKPVHRTPANLQPTKKHLHHLSRTHAEKRCFENVGNVAKWLAKMPHGAKQDAKVPTASVLKFQCLTATSELYCAT